MIRSEEAVPTSFRALPPAAEVPADKPWSLCLFYQYKEPAWSEAEHKKVLGKVIALGEAWSVTGRGRCASEGLNCTLTASPVNIRRFCESLRKWKPEVFDATDFKITDGLASHERFKALTIRKTDELVGYGLAHDLAPKLQGSSARHLEAVEYHKSLQDPEAVVIDVRNAYESEIGRFETPANGARVIDPKIRNSHEFPKWLGLPETQAQLKGRTVMMYCTGGIRCERASSLVDAMKASLAPKEILMVRGGIERYLKTYPDGGFWKGANYLFDRRFEQRSEAKEQAPLGACCACNAPCDEYRGQFSCAKADCKVPVIVCKPCRDSEAALLKTFRSGLKCRLCREGHEGARSAPLPDCLSKMRRPAPLKNQATATATLFVGNLPYTAERSELLALLRLPAETGVSWLLDRETRLFYGSALLRAPSVQVASQLVEKAQRSAPRLRKRKLRLGFAAAAAASSGDFVTADRPPVTTTVNIPSTYYKRKKTAS